MIKVTFNSFIFLRTPAASYIDYNQIQADELIKSRFFQAAIFFASESLFTELSRNNFDYYSLDRKVRLSLQKYINRICYRPTPFGMFSACSAVEWQAANSGKDNCVLGDNKLIYLNPDFQFCSELGRTMAQSNEFNEVKYFTNSAIYNIKNEKRYLSVRFDETRHKNHFFINSFQGDRLLSKLFNFCINGKTKQEIKKWLSAFVDENEDVTDYINDLIGEGLLISELTPNMSGRKYFERLADIACATQPQTAFSRDILDFKQWIEKAQKNNAETPDIDSADEKELYKQYKSKFKSMFYVGLERPVHGALNAKYQSLINEGLRCLFLISGDAVPLSLERFKGRFRMRFEDQEVPLLHAMDREAGIGYEGSENSSVASELLDGVQLDRQSDNQNFNWTPIHEFFLSRFLRTKNDDPIIITDGDLEKLRMPSALKMPASFSVVFRPLGSKIWMEQAGGCSATALLGRFTLFSERFLKETRHIAAMEEKSNPDVVFTEISCFNDEHAANINSNAGIWSYEIPIGVYSVLKPQNIIGLSDIMVSVVDNTVILRSKKLNKIIVPRLSSAYNYSRSELPVFRFLCDLQYQGLKYNFNFDLRELLPGLSYYPRVEYNNCILFPATWILSAEEIKEVTNSNPSLDEFNRFSENVHLKRHFALTEGDNQLFFDSSNVDSVRMFLNIIKNKKSAQLQEVFFDENYTVTDSMGKPFMGQFIASVFSDNKLYSIGLIEYIKNLSRKKNKVKRLYLPGNEWIYLKVYCHPVIANDILVKNVKGIINYLKRVGVLKKWFFVRYADPDTHLRIRMQVCPEGTADALKYLERKLYIEVEKGRVSNLLLDTYKREIERYGEDTIEIAEVSFCSSSELVVNYLMQLTQRQVLFSEIHFALLSANEIIEIFFPKISDRIVLLGRMYEGMQSEFEYTRQVRLQMDNKYREYAAFINNMQIQKPEIIMVAGKKEFNLFVKELFVLKSSSRLFLMDKQMKLAADLIHMHLNRIFSDSQRKHEFIIYYMLHKYYVSLAARRQKDQSVFPGTSKGFRIDEVKKTIFK